MEYVAQIYNKVDDLPYSEFPLVSDTKTDAKEEFKKVKKSHGESNILAVRLVEIDDGGNKTIVPTD